MNLFDASLRRALPLAVAGGMLVAYSAAGDARESTLSPPADFAFADIAGEWKVQAHIPYFLEKNRVAPIIAFERRDDGRYTEKFTARKGSFDAEPKTFKQVTWAPNPAEPWKLKTRLFYIIPARYQVISLDKQVGIALLGTENRDKAWIFTRDAVLDEAAYQAALKEFSRQGFDATRILRIPQVPADLGKPGYARIES